MKKTTIGICFLIAGVMLLTSFIVPQYQTIFEIIGCGVICITVTTICAKFITTYHKGKEDYLKRIEEMKKEGNE